ncbi:MAG: hypothetical protein KC713_02210 [Candidatus Omnitrophica bacterium]|nr:hypothetical protein [Candidatus Omnitrophota bacterium]
MSKATKQSIFILIFLLLCSLGFAGFTVFEKQKLTDEKTQVQQQLEQAEQRERKKIVEVQKLKEEVQALETQKTKLEQDIASTRSEISQLNDSIVKIEQDREKWKGRVDTLREERDQLMAKMKEQPEPKVIYKEAEPKIVYKYIEKEPEADQAKTNQPSKMESTPAAAQTQSASSSRTSFDEKYWADILKSKAELEVEVDELKDELSKKAIQIADLKEKNADLNLKLDTFQFDKEEINREILYKTELINNLSLDLARAKNETKYSSDKLMNLNQENADLRQQVQKLVSSKATLEKSIVELTRDKNKIEKQLGNTENIIQSKIDEIWQIKDSLDKTLRETSMSRDPNTIELPPIVVNAVAAERSIFDDGESQPGYFGNVVSINENNNFVIVDVGEKDGLQIGDTLGVYRDAKFIAKLEVIQTRRDIAAADIKEQWSQISVSDIVR